MKRVIYVLMALLFVGSLLMAAGCEQLGFGKDDNDDETTGLLLLLGLASRNTTTSSGFFVTIPNGVAK
ncbi:MAG: hypothetical protein KDK39_06990 [Leptospiraceae bacterium]|nr:hypothetical protein [Leptospiraceae bacterium]